MARKDKMENEDLKLIVFDRKGNIYNNLEPQIDEINFKNEMLGIWNDKQILCVINRKFYNFLTGYGRKKEFNIIDSVLIDHYVNCVYYNSFRFRLKVKLKRFWQILYNAIIMNRKIVVLRDVIEAKEKGIKLGLKYLKEYEYVKKDKK